jgi:pilus assembly protein Flp/PilA
MIRSWKMLNQIKKFMQDDSGLETVEWAIVGGVIVAVGAGVFALIGTDVKAILDALNLETAAAKVAAEA